MPLTRNDRGALEMAISGWIQSWAESGHYRLCRWERYWREGSGHQGTRGGWVGVQKRRSCGDGDDGAGLGGVRGPRERLPKRLPSFMAVNSRDTCGYQEGLWALPGISFT